ncbi:type II restriction enzyme [Algoriphagus sp. 4150]|uniref:HpaII family restriction endonuclease n=1 Tax=Algoriphagus sp. 4150 TaxID=2817756 RepID=UPI002865CEF3|nr:HpaII family restriction endonuclease [Algoriphagus sp. 4150]MDR7128277.1 type II restriction enzyme [Algoriphagus sp. 4150]
MMLTGNKGEWSELYTLFKIISDRKLFAGDGQLNRIDELAFPVLKVIRTESNGVFEFTVQDDFVEIALKGVEFSPSLFNLAKEEPLRIPIERFGEMARILLKEMKKASGAFAVNEVIDFINSYKCHSLKANSTVKSDIDIVLHDLRTGTTPQLGFSIKSQLGGASTLLNAGRATNFIYKITGASLSDLQINEINTIATKSKIKDRIERIRGFSGNLEYARTESAVFGNNLTLIDSALPAIVAEMVKLFFSATISKTKELISKVSTANPIGYNFDTRHPFYLYKVKRLLTDIALGMMPAKVWTGELEATGGYLIVKEGGEIVCYHIYNRNEFEDYLLNNTKFETASSSRHDFGKVYKVGDECFFKLNLQIRFLK